MNIRAAIKILSFSAFFVSSGIILTSCGEKAKEGMIVFTQVSVKGQDNSPSSEQDLKSEIASIDPERDGSQPVILTKGFFSAKSPEISCDGKTMLFAAKQKQDEPWQIWEMSLGRSKSRKITSAAENCSDPAYLPNGRVVFTKQSADGKPGSGQAIFSCKSDGSDLIQITYDPYTYSSSNVLEDGRVLSVSRHPDAAGNGSIFMVMRPDGTKNELFYKGSSGSIMKSRGRETGDGRIVFVESGSDNAGGTLVSVSYNRPLHSYSDLSSGIAGDFISVFPIKSGKYLVSYRKTGFERSGLYEFTPGENSPWILIYTSKDFDVTEAVAVHQHQRARKLPSEVDMGVKTGLLLCQDVSFLNGQPAQDPAGVKTGRIRIIGRDSIMGDINVQKDGSFFLKVKADMPFRIQTLDEKGQVTGSPCGWIYLRPNERRGCVGCHEDPDIVPDNKVSMAVRFAPVSVPVHYSKVVEKKVSLE